MSRDAVVWTLAGFCLGGVLMALALPERPRALPPAAPVEALDRLNERVQRLYLVDDLRACQDSAPVVCSCYPAATPKKDTKNRRQ